MLTTPKDPPGSAGTTARASRRPTLDEPDPEHETARLRHETELLRHEVALLTARWEVQEARTATAPLVGSTTASSERASPPAERAGTVAAWIAHHQLGVAVDSIGERVARTLGVVPSAERAAMSEAVTDALLKSARDHLDRAAAAEIRGAPRSVLERACMAALDRQAQLSIDEARRRNSLEGDDLPDPRPGAVAGVDPRHDAVSDVDPRPDTGSDSTTGHGRTSEHRSAGGHSDEGRRHEGRRHEGHRDGETAEGHRTVRVLVTDDPLVTGGDWRAQHLSAQVSTHRAALGRLTAQTETAGKDLETTLDCWVRGAPARPPAGSPDGPELTPEEQWRAQAGIADSAAAIAGGVKILAGADQAAATEQGTPLTLGLQLLELARTDLTVSHRAVSAGSHELVVRGAAALASNLGPRGTVIADELTTLAPASSPLINDFHDLLQRRADLAASTAALAGLVAFARSLAGVDAAEAQGTPPPTPGGVDSRTASRRTVAEPGLRELARQALLHEQLVEHVVDALGTLDRDLSAWLRPEDDGGSPPLLAAIGRERLHTASDRFTHVLVLQDEDLTADVVSRHSVIGDSGRRTHIGSASVSWVLLDVVSGAVVDGGQAAPARTLVQDVATGRTSSRSMSPQATAPLPWDAQRSVELALKFFAITAGLAALILSVVALVNVFLT